MSEDKRKHIRTTLTSNVKVSHPSFGTMEVTTKDISDGGIFLAIQSENMPETGEIVTVQLLDTPFEAPVLEMRIVRVEREGIGLEFVDQGE